MTGKLYIVGVGPGHHDHMTFRAKEVIEESDTIVGYETYVSLVEDLIEGKEIHRYAMTQEVERAHQCIELAKTGKIVSLVSSGDPGIYGMAGLIYEILSERSEEHTSELQSLAYLVCRLLLEKKKKKKEHYLQKYRLEHK